MMMLRNATLALITLVMVAGCTERSKRVFFDGKFYPTREKAVSKDDRAAFTVSVRKAQQGIDGAREAGRHGGSKYCIKNFGTSEIEWVNGPDDPAETLQLSNGSLTLAGRCITW
ncbi:MAG: hypothetical protein AB8B82_06240 [Roseovarius sp.]